MRTEYLTYTQALNLYEDFRDEHFREWIGGLDISHAAEYRRIDLEYPKPFELLYYVQTSSIHLYGNCCGLDFGRIAPWLQKDIIPMREPYIIKKSWLPWKEHTYNFDWKNKWFIRNNFKYDHRYDPNINYDVLNKYDKNMNLNDHYINLSVKYVDLVELIKKVRILFNKKQENPFTSFMEKI